MIEIDLDSIPSYSYQDILRVFVTNIVGIKNEYSMNNIKLEEMVISPSFWNLLVDSPSFHRVMGGISIPEDIENNVPVGHLMSIQVFVNFTLDRDVILLSPSLQNRREEKIDNILYNTDNVTLVEVKIKSTNLY